MNDPTHIATSEETPNTAVCWLMDGPFYARKTTNDPAESSCADCTDLYAAFEELDAAVAEMGEGSSAIRKFLDDYNA